ncbi:hypothetical protein ILUMI_23814 [Ignelater luminosus]|uniref:Uncharacterized protein n=1 Tax=Ignelater luminosus TaxID=2038154 RepID=A0A8K0FZB5_IGNLU|nr:hypothetical protein ILUMI_23814 [Ignelater luminosus]
MVLRNGRFMVKQAAEDADHLIVVTAIESSQSYDKVVLVAEDTCLLIILAVINTPSSNIVSLKPGKEQLSSTSYGIWIIKLEALLDSKSLFKDVITRKEEP